MMNVLRSEWTKLRSVRSTWIAAGSTVISGVALSVLGASDQLGASPSELPDSWDPTATSLRGLLFAQLVIGMFGALGVTREYATGLIGTSLGTVPSRSRLFAAKTTVAAAVALPTALATTLLSFTAGQLMLSSAGLPAADITDPDVVVALVGGTLYLTLITLIGVAVGMLTRSSTGSLAVLVGVLLLAPALLPGLPGSLGDRLAQYWPITAGQAAYTVVPVDDTVAPVLGLTILAVTAVGVSVAGHVSLRVRDI